MNSRCRFAAVVLASFGAPALAADGTPPALLAVELLDSTVNVVDGAAAPGVRLEISDDGSGLGTYAVHFQPSGYFQSVSGFDASESIKKSGSVYIRTAPLSIYHVAGPWELFNVTLCDRANNCHTYVGDELDAINPSRIVMVVNNRSPDTGPPSAKSGVVKTTTVSLGASDVRFRTLMTLNDAISGVANASVCFTSASGEHSQCAYGAYTHPAKGAQEVQEGHFTSPGDVETGVWTITSVYLTDFVGNYRSYDRPAAINALFPSGKTMTVTP
jgi:hypothetical protein